MPYVLITLGLLLIGFSGGVLIGVELHKHDAPECPAPVVFPAPENMLDGSALAMCKIHAADMETLVKLCGGIW